MAEHEPWWQNMSLDGSTWAPMAVREPQWQCLRLMAEREPHGRASEVTPTRCYALCCCQGCFVVVVPLGHKTVQQAVQQKYCLLYWHACRRLLHFTQRKNALLVVVLSIIPAFVVNGLRQRTQRLGDIPDWLPDFRNAPPSSRPQPLRCVLPLYPPHTTQKNSTHSAWDKLGSPSITFCSRFSITKKTHCTCKNYSPPCNSLVCKPYVVGFLVFLSLVQEIEIRIIQVGDQKKTTIGCLQHSKGKKMQRHLEVKEICIPLMPLVKKPIIVYPCPRSWTW
jgi:hypothetical protein